jgi:hypothetical protein
MSAITELTLSPPYLSKRRSTTSVDTARKYGVFRNEVLGGDDAAGVAHGASGHLVPDLVGHAPEPLGVERLDHATIGAFGQALGVRFDEPGDGAAQALFDGGKEPALHRRQHPGGARIGRVSGAEQHVGDGAHHEARREHAERGAARDVTHELVQHVVQAGDLVGEVLVGVRGDHVFYPGGPGDGRREDDVRHLARELGDAAAHAEVDHESLDDGQDLLAGCHVVEGDVAQPAEPRAHGLRHFAL